MAIITLVDNTIPVASDFMDSFNFINAEVRTYERGGTGQSSYAKGDLIYASAANTLAKLAIGSKAQVLAVSSAGLPNWSGRALFKSGTNRGPSTNDLSVLGGPLTLAANSLGTAGGVRVYFRCSLDNSTGIGVSYVPTVTYGSSTHSANGTGITVPNGSANYLYNGWVYLLADNATGAQYAVSLITAGGTTINYGVDASGFAIDSTAAQSFDVKITNNNAASQTVLYAMAELLA